MRRDEDVGMREGCKDDSYIHFWWLEVEHCKMSLRNCLRVTIEIDPETKPLKELVSEF